MVKFSKELEAQLIPEWKETFVNYWQLKKNIKKIKLCRNPPQIKEKHGFVFCILDPIRYTGSKIVSRFRSDEDRHEIIQVRRERGDEEERYRMHLIHSSPESNEVEEFFDRLDEELNKVNHFYTTKEREFLERGEILEKQLQILLDLKQILHDRRRKSFTCPRSNSSSVKGSDDSESVTESDEPPSDSSPANDVIVAVERNGLNFIGSGRPKAKKGKPKTMAMRIDIPATTPTRAIMAVTAMLWEDLVNDPKKDNSGDFINRKKIQRAEKMIRGAFVELYRGLELLKTFRFLYLTVVVNLRL